MGGYPFQGIAGRKLVIPGRHLNSGIQRKHGLPGGLHLEPAHVSGPVDYLSLEVGQVHPVEIDHAEPSHTRRGEVLQHRGAQASRAHHQHAGIAQAPLSFHADLGQQEVARVAQQFVV